MKIVFYTAGTSGSGRLVRGISIANALARNNVDCEFIILSSSNFSFLCDRFNVKHIEIPSEDEKQLSKENYKSSKLYNIMKELKPDILINDLLWFTLYHFIDELECKKIFMCHQVIPAFFSMDFADLKLQFKPEQYDLLLAVEPFESDYNFKYINPIILRNKNEIYTKDVALEKLNITNTNKNALFAINARPGDFERLKNKYSYLEEVGYNVIYTTNYNGGLFPVIDYFNAIDLVICIAGYNQLWECVYFNKEAVYEIIILNFSSMKKRILDSEDYIIEKNGADELSEILLNLL